MTAFLAVRLILLTLGILSAVAHWFIPRLTRPDLYFAVTVVPGFRDSAEGAFILRRYHKDLIAVTTPVMAALVVMLSTTRALPLTPLVLVLQLGTCFFIFYRARRLVLPYAAAPTTIREAQVGNRTRRAPGGWLLASGPFALLAASAYYLSTHWSRIPMRIVLHWAADGRPDRWMARSPIDVFAPLLIGLVVVCAMALVLHGMAHWLRPIYAGGAEKRQESRFRLTASVMLLALEYWVSIVASFVAARPLLPAALQHPPVLVAMVPGDAFAYVGARGRDDRVLAIARRHWVVHPHCSTRWRNRRGRTIGRTRQREYAGQVRDRRRPPRVWILSHGVRP